MRQKPDYILIAGLPRSGSTLMQSVLSNRADTYTLPETHFFEEAKKIRADYIFNKAQVCELLSLIQDKWQLPLNNLINELRYQNNDAHHDIRDVFFQLIEEFRPEDRSRSLVAIEKTPGNIMAVESVVTYRHTVKFILTCRNPIDFANSMVQQYWAPASVSQISKMWNNVMKTISGLEHQFPDRVLRVNYEHMLDRPQATFSSVCEFAGLDWDTQMLSGLNEKINRYVVTKERAWKKNNLKHNTVVKPPRRNCLNLRQRFTIHRYSLYAAIKNGYLGLYRF